MQSAGVNPYFLKAGGNFPISGGELMLIIWWL